MFCTGCGHALHPGDRFCGRCGRGATSGEAPAAAYYAPRRFFRLAYDKQVAGICSGLAKYLNVDVTLIRILFAALVLFSGGLAVFAYIFAWIITPVDYGVKPAPAPPAREAAPEDASAQPAT